MEKILQNILLALIYMNLTQLEDEIFVIESFLAHEECNDLISEAENIGFNDADVQISNGKRQILTNVRNNERVNYHSQVLADSWWEKLNKLSLPKYYGKEPIGLSPYFRFYKYTSGQKFNTHKDGRQEVGGNTTYYTLIAYLNENCIGGSTKFRRSDIEVLPKVGNVVLFQHHLWHQGMKVEEGVKYVLRTDVVFQR